MNDVAKVAVVGEYPPPSGGMGVIAEMLVNQFNISGHDFIKIRTNYNFTDSLSWVNNVKGVRGILRFNIFLWQCLQIRKVKVVHIFSNSGLNYPLFTMVAIIIGQLFNKKIIVNYHGGAAESFFKKHPALLRWTMLRIDKLIVPSGFLKDVFSCFNIDATVIPNSTNIEKFIFRKREIIAPKLLVARNLTTVYDVACAVKAFSLVTELYPDASLTIAGDGPERERLAKLVVKLKLKNITFLGNIPNEKMAEIYDKSDIFLNTSREDNMPNSILEAYSSGLPVVSTNPGGIPYIVNHRSTGLLAPVGDYNELSKLIVQLLSDSLLTTKIVDAAHEYAQSLSWSKVYLMWLNVYKELD